MVQTSFFWENLVLGDATLAPYDNDEYSDIIRKMFQRDRLTGGVVLRYANELEVTSTGGANVRVQTGAAVVDGKLYETDANVDDNVIAGPTYYVVALHKDWAAQTIRAVLRGNYATRQLALDSVTALQVDGTTWEIPLATVLTDAAPAVDTIYDERKFFIPHIELIEQQRLSAVGTFDFLNIPQIYTHLKLIGSIRSSGSGGGLLCDSLWIRFNGDVGANYDWGRADYDPNASAHFDANATADVKIFTGAASVDDQDAGVFAANEILIPDYTEARENILQSFATHVNTGAGAGAWQIRHGFGRWIDTSAITRITIIANAAPQTFEAGSVMSLYGLPR